MSTTTVKATEKVIVTAMNFFRSRYRTQQLLDYPVKKLIEKTQKEIDRRGGATVKFFEQDGFHFYTYTFNENGKEMTTIQELREGSSLSGGELWKFGYVTEDGEIVMLFGNHYVAEGRKQAVITYDVAKFYTPKGCQTFATKN